jgi:hypothetical protein
MEARADCLKLQLFHALATHALPEEVAAVNWASGLAGPGAQWSIHRPCHVSTTSMSWSFNWLQNPTGWTTRSGLNACLCHPASGQLKCGHQVVGPVLKQTATCG